MMSCDGKHITYGPYRDGDTLNFAEDLADATVSFDIFYHKIKDAKLLRPMNNMSSYYIDDTTSGTWCVIDPDGTVSDHIENLYFTFPTKPEDTVNTDMDDEVNHPKHYTGHKADIECIMFTELMPSLAANAFKYVWRCDDKGNKTEDLEKACWYLQRISNLGFYEKKTGLKVRSLLLKIIDASDFDDWHKTVLANIIRGYYCTAHDDISSQLEKLR